MIKVIIFYTIIWALGITVAFGIYLITNQVGGFVVMTIISLILTLLFLTTPPQKVTENER